MTREERTKIACSHCGDGPHDDDWRERNEDGDALLWWCVGCGRWWCAGCSGSDGGMTCDHCWAHFGSLDFVRDAKGRMVVEIRLDEARRLVSEMDDNGVHRVVRLRKLPRPVFGLHTGDAPKKSRTA